MKEPEINKTNFPDMFPHVPLNYKNFNVPVQCNFNKMIKLSNSNKGLPDTMGRILHLLQGIFAKNV